MPPFRQAVENWVASEAVIRSAVVFGSTAATGSVAPVDNWSDLDLHVTTTAPAQLEHIDWARVLPDQGYRLQAVRPATGGVRKITAVFAAGQIDLVVVPLGQLRLARLGLSLGLHRRHARLRVALDEIQTCLRGGYHFLKGEREWGAFYARVAAEMPGVRLGDTEARMLANAAVADWLWIQHKLARGELSAAQHVLHRSLAETNFRLLRELRLRRSQPLPSFGLGRHVERLLSPEELAWVRIDARCEAEALWSATERVAAGLRALMTELVGDTWRWPE